VLFSAQAAALQPRAGRARRSLFETPARLSDGRMTNLRISLPPGFPAARPSLAVTHPLMHAWVRPVPRRRVRSSWRSRWWVGRLSACPTLPARTGRWGRLHAPARQQASHTPCDASRVDRSAYSPALFLEPAVSLQASPWLSVESGAGRRGRAAGDAWAARLGARRAPGAGGHRGAGRAGGRARAVARGRPCAPRQRGLLWRALSSPREGPARIKLCCGGARLWLSGVRAAGREGSRKRSDGAPRSTPVAPRWTGGSAQLWTRQTRSASPESREPRCLSARVPKGNAQ